MSPSRRTSNLSGRALSLCLPLVLAACDAPEAGSDASSRSDGGLPSEEAPLRSLPVIDHSGWQNYAAELDPLAAHQPEPIDCNIAGWFLERGTLEISTADCNYVLVEHPSRLAFAEGTTLELELVHFDLNAPEPATAHVALLFDDALQWELEVPIPNDAYVYKVSFVATRALAEGDPIRLHLHNHGQNTWVLSSLYARVP